MARIWGGNTTEDTNIMDIWVVDVLQLQSLPGWRLLSAYQLEFPPSRCPRSTVVIILVRYVSEVWDWREREDWEVGTTWDGAEAVSSSAELEYIGIQSDLGQKLHERWLDIPEGRKARRWEGDSGAWSEGNSSYGRGRAQTVASKHHRRFIWNGRKFSQRLCSLLVKLC